MKKVGSLQGLEVEGSLQVCLSELGDDMRQLGSFRDMWASGLKFKYKRSCINAKSGHIFARCISLHLATQETFE